MTADRAGAHLPYPAAIDGYGNGGFRFAGMSHRGSILCVPAGIWAIEIAMPQAIGENEIGIIVASTPAVEHLLIGSGRDPWQVPEVLRDRLRAQGIVPETMTTGPAVRTYNQLLAEGRRVGALLLAVD